MKDDGGGRGRDGGAEDLLSPGRRNELGASEWQELERVLAVDATLRIAHQVGCDFDRIATVRAGDEALIARVADRVLGARAMAARAPAARRRGRRVAAALGLGVAFFASAAAAWWVVRSAPRSGLGPSSQAQPAPPARSGTGRRARVVASPPAPALAPETGSAASALAPAGGPVPAMAPAPTAGLSLALASRSAAGPPPVRAPARISDPALAPPSAAPSAANSAPAVRPSLQRGPESGLVFAPAPAAASATAGELFQRANSARRAGDMIAARSLYDQVETRFPASDEARLSHVSLGKLLLGAGDPRAAEAKFALYLAGGGGPLVEEALVGRAQCLERLARPADERRVWQRLADEFPSSVYASQARRRLSEVGTPAPGTAPAP